MLTNQVKTETSELVSVESIMPKAKQSQFKLKNTFAAFSQGRRRIISKELQRKLRIKR